MADYNKILRQFVKESYNENSLLLQREVDKALDSISRANTGIAEFNREIAEQLWSHTPKDSSDRVVLKQYIQSILEAQKILKNNIAENQNNLRITTNEQKIKQLQADLYAYAQDYRVLTAPFNIEQLKETPALLQSRLHVSGGHLKNNPYGSGMRQSSGIFQGNNNPGQLSSSLKWGLVISIIILFVELVLMFHKHHFLSLMSILAVLGIFFLNYFDKTYIRFVIITLVLSFIGDLVWLIALAGHYWKPSAETQHSTLQDGFLKFIVIVIPILMILKIVVAIILFRYKDNSEDVKKSVELLSMKFNLDARPFNNPITNILSPHRY